MKHWPTGCSYWNKLCCSLGGLKNSWHKTKRKYDAIESSLMLDAVQCLHNYEASTSILLLLPPSIPLNPLRCSAVKSTSRQAVYSPPSAAFITKFMMKQFCVLLLQWSRYRDRPAARETEYTSCDCRNTTVSLQWFLHKFDGMGLGWG